MTYGKNKVTMIANSNINNNNNKEETKKIHVSQTALLLYRGKERQDKDEREGAADKFKPPVLPMRCLLTW